MKKFKNTDDVEKMMDALADYNDFLSECAGESEEELSEDELSLVTAAGSGSMSYAKFVEKYLGGKN